MTDASGAGAGEVRVGRVLVRAAVERDVGGFAAIEVAAGERFREVGLDAVADDEPLPLDVLLRAVAEGRAWVAELDGEVVGYAMGERLGADPPQHHLAQVSVVPDAGGHGVGASLVDAVVRWAQEEGGRSLTLTTFTTVAWNAPWYQRLGFEPLASDRLDAVLAEVVEHEAALGLDPSTRCVMRRSW